jgi:hypothetical protein
MNHNLNRLTYSSAEKEAAIMKTLILKIIPVMFLLFIAICSFSEGKGALALDSESLNADVPQEASKELKDTTPSESKKALKDTTPSESSKELKDTTPSESSKTLKDTTPSESSKELKDTTPSESLNDDGD